MSNCKESYIRVVQNIIKNTLTHAAEGKYIGIFLKCDEKNVFVDIADKGQGIGEEHLPYVFERLYKVDQVRSRSGGLGLAIAKELANKMNVPKKVLTYAVSYIKLTMLVS